VDRRVPNCNIAMYLRGIFSMGLFSDPVLMLLDHISTRCRQHQVPTPGTIVGHGRAFRGSNFSLGTNTHVSTWWKIHGINRL
jgi:hypothetical protein